MRKETATAELEVDAISKKRLIEASAKRYHVRVESQKTRWSLLDLECRSDEVR